MLATFLLSLKTTRRSTKTIAGTSKTKQMIPSKKPNHGRPGPQAGQDRTAGPPEAGVRGLEGFRVSGVRGPRRVRTDPPDRLRRAGGPDVLGTAEGGIAKIQLLPAGHWKASGRISGKFKRKNATKSLAITGGGT